MKQCISLSAKCYFLYTKKEEKRIELVEFYAMLPSSTQIKCEQLNI